MSLSIQSKSPFPPSTGRPLPPLISAKRRAVVRGSSSSQCAPRLPAALQVLHSRDFRNHIFSYLKFTEIPLVGNMTRRLSRLGLNALTFYHKNRVTFAPRDECDQIIKAFKIKYCKSDSLEPWKSILASADNHFPQLTTLDLSYTDYSLISSFTLPTTRLPSVTKLNLRYANVNFSSHLETLFSKLTRLENLILRKCEYVDESALLTVARRGANLISLDLSKCAAINPTTIKALASNCLRLKSLYLDLVTNIEVAKAISGGFTSLNYLRMEVYGDSVIPFIKLRELKELSLSGVSTPVNQRTLDALSRGCHNLIFLYLSCFEKIANDTPSDGVCGKLETLHLDNLVAVNPTNITTLNQQCPVLTSLSISCHGQIDEGVLPAIAGAFSLLHTLTLKDCFANKKGLRALALRRKALASLTLGDSAPLDSRCLKILTRFSSLTSLDISRSGTHKAALKAFAARASYLPKLTSLNISECNVTEKVVRALAYNCISLTSIDLTFGSPLCFPEKDRRAIFFLKAQFPHLKFIDDF